MSVSNLDDLIREGTIDKASWKLDADHELQCRVEGDNGTVAYKGSLIAAEPDLLVVALTGKACNGELTTRTVKLSGAWKFDDRNRIAFEVGKEGGRQDVLTFNGAWTVDENNRIVYTYTRKSGRRAPEEQTLEFAGSWSLSDGDRLVYALGMGSDSAFEISGAFEAGRLEANKRVVRYRLGAGVKGTRKACVITLSGEWRVTRDLELCFEVERESGAAGTLSFGADYAVSKTTSVSARLRSKSGDPLGVELVLTRAIFGKDGEMFLRLQQSARESRIEAGVELKW
jgi:hypothetical protein